MKRLLSQIIATALGLWLSTIFVSGVIIRTYPSSNLFGFPLTQQWHIFLVLGVVLSLLNYFLKPALKALSLPLAIFTFGLFTILINMGLIWILDKMFDELTVPLFLPLIYTTIIIWTTNLIINFFTIKK